MPSDAPPGTATHHRGAGCDEWGGGGGGETRAKASGDEAGDSGPQKVQRESKNRSSSHLNNVLTTMEHMQNSTDSCMGRRPVAKSDEFVKVSHLVVEKSDVESQRLSPK